MSNKAQNPASCQTAVSGSFPIKETYTIEEVKKIALAFTRAATPSKYIGGIDERFEQVWRLNFGSLITANPTVTVSICKCPFATKTARIYTGEYICECCGNPKQIIR